MTKPIHTYFALIGVNLIYANTSIFTKTSSFELGLFLMVMEIVDFYYKI